MIYLVTGSRDWTDVPCIRREMEKLDPRNDIVIHGGCKGADMITDEVCRELGIHTARVDALWDIYCRAAGPIRNSMMAYLKPDKGLAFHNDLANSKGTNGMVHLLADHDVPVTVCTS